MAAAAAAAAARVAPRPSLEAVWHALDAVPDPEIPVVSVVELGIVRGVEWDHADPATLVVRVTPTYSGCPATELIMNGIRDALTVLGVVHVRLETKLSPAWTTDWIVPGARRKLREYGIAPPAGADAEVGAARVDVSGISPLRRTAVVVPCPRCGSAQTTLVSQFGSTACKAHYRCADCLEPFDYFKPH
ncbi:MAG: 1,2-phenylacetyl-CoA epoxidase subunit PaaD [Betaproteobacteria bacterium]